MRWFHSGLLGAALHNHLLFKPARPSFLQRRRSLGRHPTDRADAHSQPGARPFTCRSRLARPCASH